MKGRSSYSGSFFPARSFLVLALRCGARSRLYTLDCVDFAFGAFGFG